MDGNGRCSGTFRRLEAGEGVRRSLGSIAMIGDEPESVGPRPAAWAGPHLDRSEGGLSDLAEEKRPPVSLGPARRRRMNLGRRPEAVRKTTYGIGKHGVLDHPGFDEIALRALEGSPFGAVPAGLEPS
jgi:hypothetical protein